MWSWKKNKKLNWREKLKMGIAT